MQLYSNDDDDDSSMLINVITHTLAVLTVGSALYKTVPS